MPTPQPISRYILAYLFWAATVAVTVFELLTLRTTLMLVSALTGWDRYITHAINQFGFLFLAIATLSVVIFCEHFYRTGVEKEQLFSRFLLVLFVMAAVMALAHILQTIAEIVLGIPTTTFTHLITLGEVVVAGVLYWVWRRMKNKR